MKIVFVMSVIFETSHGWEPRTICLY